MNKNVFSKNIFSIGKALNRVEMAKACYHENVMRVVRGRQLIMISLLQKYWFNYPKIFDIKDTWKGKR